MNSLEQTQTMLDTSNEASLASSFLTRNYVEENAQGLTMIDPNQSSATTYLSKSQLAKAKEDAETVANGGVNFKPPSTGQMLLDMLGSMLITYGASRLLGIGGSAALGLGLTASAVAHDKDKQENERFEILQNSIKENGNIYSSEMLWNFMKTGDGKAMMDTEKNQLAEKNKREDAETKHGWDVDAAQQAEQWKQEDDNTSFEHQKELHSMPTYHDLHSQSGSIGSYSSTPAITNRAKQIVDTGIDPATGKPATKTTMDWAQNHITEASSVTGNTPRVKLTGNYTADHAKMDALKSFARTHSKAIADWNKSKQADARMNAVDTSTPIGQIADAYQFLTVEAPSISNTVSTASGVSDEAVTGWADKINQMIQDKVKNKGKFTPEEISEMKDAAHKETEAMNNLMSESAKPVANAFDLNDRYTRSQVAANTGLTTEQLDQLAKEQDGNVAQPVANANSSPTNNTSGDTPEGQPTNQPKGQTLEYKGVKYVSNGSTWEKA
ncbi:hypothetical protein PYR66_09900 [Klebsiella aerogenes]|nr:hypothetical protein PYR66_09900 [Klebsiella aerogenes]